MNKERIKTAIAIALNSADERYRSVCEKHSGLSEDMLECVLNHVLSDPIATILQEEPEFEKGYITRWFGAQCPFKAEHAAEALIKKARKERSADAAIEWLEKVLSTQSAAGYYVMALWGISCDERVNLSNSVDLVPIELIPDSSHKEFLIELREPRVRFNYMGVWSPVAMGNIPEVALICETNIDPFIIDLKKNPQPEANLSIDEHYLLDDIRRVLTLVGPSPILNAMYWFQIKDQDLEYACMLSGCKGCQYNEIMPMVFDEIGAFNSNLAQKLVKAYLNLKSPLKDRVSISLDRLNQAMRRNSPGDKAIDLSIALESILVDNPGEHNFKTSLRAALIATEEFEERRQVREVIKTIYEMRSAMVHSGKDSKKKKLRGKSKIPQDETMKKAFHICSKVIQRILELGDSLNWDEIELRGNL